MRILDLMMEMKMIRIKIVMKKKKPKIFVNKILFLNMYKSVIFFEKKISNIQVNLYCIFLNMIIL